MLFLQAEQLRQHYMTKYDSEVADAYQNLQPVLQNIKELKRKVSKKKNNSFTPEKSCHRNMRNHMSVNGAVSVELWHF